MKNIKTINGKNYKLEIVEYFYSVEICLNNPNKLFIFGDNTQRYGKAGQAQIRECQNSVGLATKFNPGMNDYDFFSDARFEECSTIMERDVQKIINCLTNPSRGFDTLVFPVNGFGTGLSQLPEKAPRTYGILCKLLNDYFGIMTDTRTKRLV